MEPMIDYKRLELNIKSLASKHALISEKTGKDRFRFRIQPTGLVETHDVKPHTIQLYTRVSLETGSRTGLPLRAYIRAGAKETQDGNFGELRIGPGWPRSPMEFFLDALWYGMMIFPAVTFLVSYVLQPSKTRGLSFLLFLILFIADRVAVWILYRKGREFLEQILTGQVEISIDAPETTSPRQIQDWLGRFRSKGP
jgi:hypothetical protein